ncbi:uncharacterized protein SCDLUD_000686 [Saccharomycodes ludwigii]|uniref:uncharacterized protein n=1 Tax=Saccharomycodes ludwigii TaxID=36035 RepID=UPI001E877070|nr:hypothetical protein SCDLUD_000686 [Saccharomycodes ludwigii]KAH3903075.1 hypothetical protein SCDLUD_000686 [Saccharomycodes ludwigii]
MSCLQKNSKGNYIIESTSNNELNLKLHHEDIIDSLNDAAHLKSKNQRLSLQKKLEYAIADYAEKNNLEFVDDCKSFPLEDDDLRIILNYVYLVGPFRGYEQRSVETRGLRIVDLPSLLSLKWLCVYYSSIVEMCLKNTVVKFSIMKIKNKWDTLRRCHKRRLLKFMKIHEKNDPLDEDVFNVTVWTDVNDAFRRVMKLKDQCDEVDFIKEEEMDEHGEEEQISASDSFIGHEKCVGNNNSDKNNHENDARFNTIEFTLPDDSEEEEEEGEEGEEEEEEKEEKNSGKTKESQLSERKNINKEQQQDENTALKLESFNAEPSNIDQQNAVIKITKKNALIPADELSESVLMNKDTRPGINNNNNNITKRSTRKLVPISTKLEDKVTKITESTSITPNTNSNNNNNKDSYYKNVSKRRSNALESLDYDILYLERKVKIAQLQISLAELENKKQKLGIE